MEYYVCDVCGAKFNDKYWEGGYIDHTNLTDNRHLFNEDNEDELIDEIAGSESEGPREKDDIKVRLNCVMHWDHLSEDFKKKIKARIDEFLKEMS